MKKRKVKKGQAVFYIKRLNELIVMERLEVKKGLLTIHCLGNRTEPLDVDISEFYYIGTI